jgi:hypothetical protein
MPFSTKIFKEETINFIKRKFNKDTLILDVGAGAGTYGELLKSDFSRVDAIEVFEPYINQYELYTKYRNVFIDNIVTTNINLDQYQLFILGDVFEHLSESDARILLDTLLATGAEIIISVPFNSVQGEVFGNPFEQHRQPKLSLLKMLKMYPELIPLCIRYDYGVFITKNPENEFLPIFYKDLDEDFVKKLQHGYTFRSLINVDTLGEPSSNIIELLNIEERKKDVTIVTGLWNLGRGHIGEQFGRSYDHYREKFAELLKSPVNMVIYVSKDDEDFIWQHRERANTFVKIMELDEFDTWFEFFEKVQTIRTRPDWYTQAGWLVDSPQAKLKYYNPVVMSKMFMLNNATLYNPFDSSYFYWIDAGITNTVHPGYFTHDNVFNKLPIYTDAVDAFTFLSYPYEGGNEIHGFPRTNIEKYCGTDYVKYVCRGGFFGGKKSDVGVINSLYHGMLASTLSEGLMGTEESIFTILAHKFPEIILRFEIEGNGLVWPFFEKLKNVEELVNSLPEKPLNVHTVKNNLYILTFNSPQQFESICKSIQVADDAMYSRSRKILINNSTDASLFAEYDRLCQVYNFEEIHRENLGVCGGRQFVAEHFDTSDAHFYMFFEDDMHVNGSDKVSTTCSSGFRQYVPNLYESVIKIMLHENFDFLKFSFTEFYGNNGTQWAWYNVPQTVRTEIWPHYDKLPENGTDPNAPKTLFKHIKILDAIPYITGEIYYSNWPQIVSRAGNKKMFLDTTWSHPFEQTWMSHMFQLTRKHELTSAILLASPITHFRFDHYDGNLRKES